MPGDMQALIITAVSIACLHTLTGPDHYLPFIALSKAKGWNIAKTIGWTITCGLGHVLSSVALGLGGAALGWSLSKASWLENTWWYCRLGNADIWYWLYIVGYLQAV